MRIACRFSLLIALLTALFNPTEMQAQYYNERVLEKSFEQADFFFQPSFLNPYGIGGFGRAAPGFIDDLLLNLQMSPAFPAFDSLNSAYVYLDFRNSRQVENEDIYYPRFVAYDCLCSIVSYPAYFANTRRELEPVFSGALFFRPARKTLPGLALGLTYQAIFRDEGYYAIPHDIYRAQAGYNYEGARTLDANVPIDDIYLGDDDMHQVGHFAALYASYVLTPRLRLGLRASRATFDRDGTSGNQNRWRNTYGQSATSFWFSREERVQAYDHWDLSSGLDFEVSPGVHTGFSVGYLDGDATQTLVGADSSRYEYGMINVGTNWSLYVQDGLDDQQWAHTGGSVYGSAYLQTRLGDDRTLTLYYRGLREDLDLSMRSAIQDTSSSNYYNEYNDWVYSGQSYYSVRDVRAGAGERTGSTHRLTGTLQWQLDEKTHLNLGAHLQVDARRTQTTEDVEASLANSYTYTSTDGNGDYHDAYARREAKQLIWDFESRVSSIQIPVLLTRRLSDAVAVLFGLNRQMAHWRIEDETLAIFDERVVTENGVTTRREDFGERYREPIERRTDVQTTVLGGLVVTPAQQFDVRLLVVPHFYDAYAQTRLRRYQWWISFNVKP